MGWFSKSDKDFFLSTTTPEGITRGQYLGVVNGEAVIGANIFRDMFASVRDVVGGRAGGYERALSGTFLLRLSNPMTIVASVAVFGARSGRSCCVPLSDGAWRAAGLGAVVGDAVDRSGVAA